MIYYVFLNLSPFCVSQPFFFTFVAIRLIIEFCCSTSYDLSIEGEDVGNPVAIELKVDGLDWWKPEQVRNSALPYFQLG